MKKIIEHISDYLWCAAMLTMILLLITIGVFPISLAFVVSPWYILLFPFTATLAIMLIPVMEKILGIN